MTEEYIVRIVRNLENDDYDCITMGELIRCRDCKNWLEYKQGGVGECVINHRYDHRSYVTNGKDYCSMAERIQHD